eukprot:2142815-Rhodomonas_salina.1
MDDRVGGRSRATNLGTGSEHANNDDGGARSSKDKDGKVDVKRTGELCVFRHPPPFHPAPPRVYQQIVGTASAGECGRARADAGPAAAEHDGGGVRGPCHADRLLPQAHRPPRTPVPALRTPATADRQSNTGVGTYPRVCADVCGVLEQVWGTQGEAAFRDEESFFYVSCAGRACGDAWAVSQWSESGASRI